MVQTVWLTQAGKSRLEEELQDLRTRRRPELHTRIQEATESGDISDNSEYEELKDEWASLEARIFAPLGMKDTITYPPSDKFGRMPTAYILKDGKPVKYTADPLGGSAADRSRSAI